MTDTTVTRVDQLTAVVHAGTDIDNRHAAALRDTLLDLHADGVRQVVIDMAGVETADRTGLSVLYRAWRRAGHNGGRLAIAAPQPSVRAALDDIRFPAQIHESVEDSLQRTTATV